MGFEVFADAFAERLRLEVFGAGDGVLGDAGVAVRVRQVLFDEAGDFVGAVVEEGVVFVAKAVAQADVVARVGGDDDGTAGHCPDHRGRVVVVVFGDVEEEVFAADQAAAHVLPEGVFVERFEVYRLFGEGMAHGVGVVAGAVVEVAGGLSQCFGAGVEVFGVIDLRQPKRCRAPARCILARRQGRSLSSAATA